MGLIPPEIKGHNEDEKQVAKDVRDVLSDELLHRVVRLKNVQTDKYRRILADVYLGDLHVNKWLIDNNYTVTYDGEKTGVSNSTLSCRMGSVIFPNNAGIRFCRI